MKEKLYYFLILILLIPYNSLFGQNFANDSTKYAIEAQYHYGIVIPHHSNMVYLIEDYVRGGEITFLRKRRNQGVWENYFHKPQTGIGLWYNSLGNKKVFGNAYSIYPFIDFSIFHHKRVSLRFKTALGLGYADNPFDIKNNINNTVFGSNLNAYIGFALKANYRLTDNISLLSALSLNHLSNGSTIKPNNGINTSSMTIGLTYDLQAEQLYDYKKIKPPKSKSREILTTFNAGRNQASNYNQKRYWSGTLAITHLWHTSKIKAYGAGLELFRFGGAVYAWNNSKDIDIFKEYSAKDFLFAGSYATMESYLGGTTIFFTLGAYLITPSTPKQPLYGRVGVRQKIYKNLDANFGIKANFFTAEFIEFGLAYRWKYKKQ